MIRQLIRIRRKRVLIDVDTQRDFLVSSGNACVRNHRRVLANIRRVMAWARSKNVRIISTAEVHPDDGSNGQVNYCLEGSEGQKKVSYTLMGNRAQFIADGSTDLPVNVLWDYQQVILEKRCTDPFAEPRIERLLTEIKPDEFIVVGSSTDGAVKAMVLGLLQRGNHVSIVVDAIGSQDKKASEMAIRQMQAKGAKLIETKKLAGSSHLYMVGACGCERCRGLMRKSPVGAASD